MSAEVCRTDEDKTLAEDDQNDSNSGNMDQRFERITVPIQMIKGKRFGLGIMLVHQRIIVCKVDDESLVSGILKVGDQITQINGDTVTDKEKCRKLLISNLHKKGKADVSLIRPKTNDAICTIMEEIQLNKKPSIMKEDLKK
ncbi:unnamed protein product [Caenorhabditis bovis]|uniref:PDZ domain-containing protein n=1 Tax=Caenorhabditis bovis TaxID=2654633 RepID=A0A8S1EW41_9PELO|nr:unnamed protein product [Caenorhabditis bovis]